jgi:hypothetical protein
MSSFLPGTSGLQTHYSYAVQVSRWTRVLTLVRHSCNVLGMTTTLSKAAQEALLSTRSNRQGETVPKTTDVVVISELSSEGLIGPGNGLTRRGTIVRERLFDQIMDLF